jgi:AsmA family protein
MQVPKKAWIVLAVAAVVAIAIALFEWNWLRGPIADYASARVGRPVAIAGDLRGEWSLKPLLSADAVTVGNTGWSTEPVMARAQRVDVRVDLLSLLAGPVALPEVTMVQPQVLLERDADGNGNWKLQGPNDVPLIGRLNIEDGIVRFRHPDVGTDVTINVASAAASESGATPVHFSGSGRLRNNPFTIEGDAASLLALENQDKPYSLNLNARAGYTSARFDGTVIPARLDNVDGALTLQGRDLSQLYPLIPVPFPWTPAYRVSGRLTHGGHLWTFHEFTGKVGDSDVAGNFALDRSRQIPRVDADVVSQRLDYKDLGGLIGLPPANAPPSARTAEQNKEVAKRERSGRVLPKRPYDVEQLRLIDANVRLKGKRFMASNLPLDDMKMTIDLQGGVLKLQPLDFGIAGGHVASTLVLYAREKIIKTSGEVTARNVELKQILPQIKPPSGSAGKFGGRARFTASGNSVADMLGSSNGEVAIISSGGDASELAIVLTNLDLARAAQLLVRGDTNSPIRCVVADFVAENGMMAARTLVMDTEAEKILGEGNVDFTNERYDLKLNAHSKKPSALALRGPILVEGSFNSPNIHPAVGPIAVRVGTSVALAVAATPVAALLPLIDLGGATDADCEALMQDAHANVEAKAAKPPRSAARAGANSVGVNSFARGASPTPVAE